MTPFYPSFESTHPEWKISTPITSYTMWVIIGTHGLYVGTQTTRKDMIAEHVRLKNKCWAQCRKDGDRCVKVLVTILDDERLPDLR